MPSLPQSLKRGDTIASLVPWSQNIVEYLRAITIRPSATVSVSTTANGTLLSAAASSRTVRATAAELQLNQFKVTCKADPEYVTEGEEELEGADRHFLVSVAGGTAQTMFGKITLVEDVEAEAITLGEDEYCFISLVYTVEQDSDDSHEFSDELDFHIGEEPPENTPQPDNGGNSGNDESRFHFPIAVVKYDGTVLQGHLGAVYLAGPRNLVELDERTEETVEDEEEEQGGQQS